MSDAWSERLSEYLDGELTETEARGLESHLLECEACRRNLAGLRSVVARLAADPVTPRDQPTDREWSAIRHSIAAPRRRWLIPAAIAASLVGLGIVGSLLWRGVPPGPEAMALPAAYRQASGDLETILRENTSRLRPETVKALEASLAAIDSAIAQAERALAADPANDYVTRSVSQLRDTRLMTLRRAVAVVHLRS